MKNPWQNHFLIHGWRLHVVFLVIVFLGLCSLAQAARTVVIGDSLSAEYEAIPNIPGVEDPTAYAAVSVAGWEAMSWVEVLGRLRPAEFDFGRYETGLLAWGPLRFSGYELNFAIPGFTAAQYQDIVTSTFISNFQYWTYRRSLEDALDGADRVIVWLGANEFRANYGYLYDGGDPANLLGQLTANVAEVLDFVRARKGELEIVVVTIPDLGAAPDKYEDHTDPAGQALATQVVIQANESIKDLAQARGIAVADAFSFTGRLMDGEEFYFAGVNLLPGLHPDNHPRYHFARDGLHPNTCSQVEIARSILGTCNEAFAAGLTSITDAEALGLLGIDPQLVYWEWMEPFTVTEPAMAEDPDQDGLNNLVEFAFGLDPSQPSENPVAVRRLEDRLEIAMKSTDTRHRLAQVVMESSTNLKEWRELDVSEPIPDGMGNLLIEVPSDDEQELFVRVSVTLLAGSE